MATPVSYTHLIKELMTSYQKLILENQIVLEELDMECQEKINEDMAYALSYPVSYTHLPRNDLPEGYAPKEVIAMLNPLRERLLCVRGNCDTEVDQICLLYTSTPRLRSSARITRASGQTEVS